MEKSQRNGRKFGLTMAGAATAFALLALYRHRPTTALVLGAMAALFAVFALTVPKLLEPIEAVWMALAQVLGDVNTKILLSVMYFLVFTPVGLLMRLFGRDTMNQRRRAGVGTNWEDYRGRQHDESHYENMF